jgi:hypothetical protein
MTRDEDGAIDASMTDDGSIAEPSPPDPGELYGPCRTNGSCDSPLFCAFAMFGSTETHCTMFCSASGLGQSCPEQPSGAPGSCIANVCAR